MQKGLFTPADILIPKEPYRERFAVVACDQYTSEPEYWNSVERLVGGHPSALRMIVPEKELSSGDVARKIQDADRAMEAYRRDGVFDCAPDSFVYVERRLRNGKIRRGLVGKLDLNAYDYEAGTRPPVRATEATVPERVPPRVAVRKDAVLEMPHILLLIDDPGDKVLSLAQNGKRELLYNFPLMMDSGYLSGWRIHGDAANRLTEAVDQLGDPENFRKQYGEAPPLVIAVGDGNHSLAAAKACYQALCAKIGADRAANHPMRYALAEIVNLRDPELEFEPIHRIVLGVDRARLVPAMRDALCAGESGTQSFQLVLDGKAETVRIGKPSGTMAVGTLQKFLDEYIAENGGSCDYIHGEETVGKLSERPDAAGFLLPPVDKSDLFRTVIADGALTRKTFSMGSAEDKRFYFECREIDDPQC